MNLEIRVNSTIDENKGKYNQLTVGYTDINSGKDFTYKLMSFLNKDGYNLLKDAKSGDEFQIIANKNDKGYWQWDEIYQGGAPVAKTKATTSPRSTYETPEERAQKQVYIIRQSCLANAVAYYGKFDGMPSVDQVLEVAAQFESFVFRVEEDPFQPESLT